jgi:hypothetical protein
MVNNFKIPRVASLGATAKMRRLMGAKKAMTVAPAPSRTRYGAIQPSGFVFSIGDTVAESIEDPGQADRYC